MKEKLISKIESKLKVAYCNVTDDSDKHRGHAGWQPGGETHFTVVVVSDDFDSMTRIQRHKTIYSLLKEEIDGGIHALALHTYTPEEAKNKGIATS